MIIEKMDSKEHLINEILTADTADTETFFVDYQDIGNNPVNERTNVRNAIFSSFLKRKILVNQTIKEIKGDS